MNQQIADLHNSYANGTTVSEIIEAATNADDTYCAIESRLTNFAELITFSQAQLESGAVRPLEGIPFSVKANINIKGVTTTNGALVDGKPEVAHAAVVQNLCDAGAIPVFTTTMAELALGAVTNNVNTGICLSPLDTSRHAGGSSGGSGASVAADWVPFSLGSDTMGSVRIPAAYCGVVGFKPSAETFDCTGLTPLYPQLDTIGILANSVTDIEKIFRVCNPVSVASSSTKAITLAIPSFISQAEPQVLREFNLQVAKLCAHAEENNFEIIEVDLDLDLGLIRRRGLLLIESAGWKTFVEDGLLPGGISEPVAALLQYGHDASESKISEAQFIISETKKLVSNVLGSTEKNIFLVLPTTPKVYPNISASEMELATTADFTCLANICDLPAISLPINSQAIQLMGASGNDVALLAAALLVEGLFRD